MKRTRTILSAVLCLLAISACSLGVPDMPLDYDAFHSAATGAEQAAEPGAPAAGGRITPEKAKELALAHAGLAAEDVTFLRAELGQDGGQTIYDVEFCRGILEYDYEIDAATGAVSYWDFDIESYPAPQASSPADAAPQQTAPQSSAGPQTGPQATPQPSAASQPQSTPRSSAAVQTTPQSTPRPASPAQTTPQSTPRPSAASQPQPTPQPSAAVQPTPQPSVPVQATPQPTPQPTPAPQPTPTPAPTQSRATISAAQAKSIALGAAGVSAGNARFTKVAFDYDDGVPVYEIEFIAGNMEYEFDIHARTGAILDRSVEPIDD